MSTRRGTQHLKRRRGMTHFTLPRPGEAVAVATLMGWAASKAELPAAHRATHDALIRSLGDRRRGGVSWLDIPAAEAPAFMAEEQATSLGTEGTGHVTQAKIDAERARLVGLINDNPGSFLVVAMADGAL